ncbi:hypothetical protein [Chryseobacterium scophthalmum]|uniref:Uncharacterized protein n=1 Tax=Chryseobacterium scophthalmum TaxID=59733 RepID=A0A1N6HLK5_9FLAO|nr:hypothetical protein [Chryseobacterium scophthalmum]SIO20734.1 hypothetical protein SAMN05421769_2648 [Chryseobacterium scophthalmum]
MNSTLHNAEQLKTCSKSIQKSKTENMETPNHNSAIVFNEDLYTITWADIENTEIDYENYLDDIENFFREDFENDILEEEFDTKKDEI